MHSPTIVEKVPPFLGYGTQALRRALVACTGFDEGYYKGLLLYCLLQGFGGFRGLGFRASGFGVKGLRAL